MPQWQCKVHVVPTKSEAGILSIGEVICLPAGVCGDFLQRHDFGVVLIANAQMGTLPCPWIHQEIITSNLSSLTKSASGSRRMFPLPTGQRFTNIQPRHPYRRIRGWDGPFYRFGPETVESFGISLDVLFSNTSEMVFSSPGVVNPERLYPGSMGELRWKIARGSWSSDNIIHLSAGIYHLSLFPRSLNCPASFLFSGWLADPAPWAPNTNCLKLKIAVPRVGYQIRRRKMWTTYSSMSSDIWNEEAVYDTLGAKIESFTRVPDFFSHPRSNLLWSSWSICWARFNPKPPPEWEIRRRERFPSLQ